MAFVFSRTLRRGAPCCVTGISSKGAGDMSIGVPTKTVDRISKSVGIPPAVAMKHHASRCYLGENRCFR